MEGSYEERKRKLEEEKKAEEVLDLVVAKLPNYEKVVLKEVPAKVDGLVVGTAVIYEDGTSDVILYDDIPDEARQKILGAIIESGYSQESESDGIPRQD